MGNFHFGENLRHIRTAKGISQKAMAHHLEVSQPTYSRLESEERAPNHTIVAGISKMLGVPITELLPHSRLTYKAKAILDSPFGIILIIVSFCSLGPAAWGLTDAICEMNDVSEDTTVILRRLTIPVVIIIIWSGLAGLNKVVNM